MGRLSGITGGRARHGYVYMFFFLAEKGRIQEEGGGKKDVRICRGPERGESTLLRS